jgi:predicted dehydrogenase
MKPDKKHPKKKFNIGLVGCGAVGLKRINSLDSNVKLIGCTDINAYKTMQFIKNFDKNKNIKIFDNWLELINSPNIDIVIVATPHNLLSKITIAAIEAKKNVLVEKPGGCNSKDLLSMIKKAAKNKVKVHVGFNHRYHPSLIKARKLVNDGVIGELMFIRARYGHGGRIGYEKEWRLNPKLSGGGELIDQGIHLIDLSRWFLGELVNVHGYACNYFWNSQVEDNGFMTLKTKENKVAFLHASCTEWKNIFSMEIYGKLGKLDLNGLGGSYGLEKLTFYKMSPKMGPPKEKTWKFPLNDVSWNLEMRKFIKDIEFNRKSNSSLKDAYSALKIIEKIYKVSGYDYRS